MSAAPAAPAATTIGLEEELLVVDPVRLALRHEGVALLKRVSATGPPPGEVKPDTYAALVELAAPPAPTAAAGTATLGALRGAVRDAGGTLIGAGIHPDGDWGDVEHVDEPRYHEIVDQLRGLAMRTPTCALHVHCGMPDLETVVRACNGLREHLPLLQALAANSPYWFGRDSGLATSRAQLFRAYPRAEIPRAFADASDYQASVDAICAAGGLADYTYLWWDVRPHPRMGTVEVRAMDSQSALWTVAALGALIQSLAREAAGIDGPWAPREALMEASYSAARDGLGAWLPLDGGLAPVADVARAALDRARPHARALGVEPELNGIERILADGNGADRQRRAFAGGGMFAVLRLLADEAAEPYAP